MKEKLESLVGKEVSIGIEYANLEGNTYTILQKDENTDHYTFQIGKDIAIAVKLDHISYVDDSVYPPHIFLKSAA